ncbi:MAG: glutaredoxin family protein [Nitrospiraceae bacterium]|nr:MAG: glutaredoxin family protein [Nitrospiraceae bacterium]
MVSARNAQKKLSRREAADQAGSKIRLVRVTFYYKEGCWLCDSAEEMLNGLKEKYDIRVARVAIDSDDELYELYRFDIPVFEFRDGSTLNGRIKKQDLLKKFDENRESGQ